MSPGHDPDPEGPESPAARHGVTDEEDIDFHFGMRAGDPQPTARASVDVDLTRAPGRPKAAAKMLVRSGLRCPKCLLKTWVCLCNRAPRELDRRGTAPRPYERYWLFCLPCRHFVVPFRPRAVCCWHPAHSGSAGVRHHRWLAAITVRSAVVSPKPLYPRTSPPEVPCHHSITWQLFMRYSYCKTPPSPRRAKLQPNRGPKSVPEPYFGHAELVPSPGRVGQSLANTPRHVGPGAPSPDALTRALEEMELVALNTWCSRTPHTNFTSTGNSQIDFIWVRGASADKIARKCQPTDPAIGSWRYMGHKQLVASIRLIRHYHLAKPQGGQPGVDRNTLSEHVRVNHPSTSALRSQVQAALSREGNSTPAAALHKLNAILLEASAAIYPPKSKASEDRRLDFEPLWKLRDALRRHWRRDLQGLFKAWFLSHRLAKLARDARRRHVELQRERVSNILQSTQAAADERMPHKVYQLVSQLKPWCPRPRPRLNSYCQETFAPALPVPEAGPPRLHMSAADWTKYLGQTRIGKAVPRGCAPAATWKACSGILGPYLERVSQAALLN